MFLATVTVVMYGIHVNTDTTEKFESFGEASSFVLAALEEYIDDDCEDPRTVWEYIDRAKDQPQSVDGLVAFLEKFTSYFGFNGHKNVCAVHIIDMETFEVVLSPSSYMHW